MTPRVLHNRGVLAGLLGCSSRQGPSRDDDRDQRRWRDVGRTLTTGRLGAATACGSGRIRCTELRTVSPMAYDERLAARIRELVGDEPGLTEKKMFGGLAFLVNGNMAIAASGQGGVLVRADPEQSDELVATTKAELMEMRGRSMRGWLRVADEDIRGKPQLRKWAELGTAYARSLPPK